MFDRLPEIFANLLELPREPLLYEAGGIIFAFALMGFAHTVRRILYIIGRRGIWVLPYSGAILMLVVVGLHCYGNYGLDLRDPGARLLVHQFRFIALLAMVASSAATLAGAITLWFWLTGSRAGPADGKAA